MREEGYESSDEMCNDCPGCDEHDLENENEHEVEIDLPDNTFLQLAKMAHDNDITFNQQCNNILSEFMIKYDNYEEINNFIKSVKNNESN